MSKEEHLTRDHTVSILLQGKLQTPTILCRTEHRHIIVEACVAHDYVPVFCEPEHIDGEWIAFRCVKVSTLC